MNKILDLAKTFQETSKKELENTNEIVENAIKSHERNLLEQLKNANRNLAENIQTEQAKLIKNTVKMYRLPTIIALSIMMIIIAISAGLTWIAKESYQDMMKWKQSAEIVQKQSGGIVLSTCSIAQGKSKACVEIDQEYMDRHWGKNGNLMIIKVYDQKGK